MSIRCMQGINWASSQCNGSSGYVAERNNGVPAARQFDRFAAEALGVSWSSEGSRAGVASHVVNLLGLTSNLPELTSIW